MSLEKGLDDDILHSSCCSSLPVSPLLQNVKNMTIKIIKFVGFIRRCAATRQKGFHVRC